MSVNNPVIVYCYTKFQTPGRLSGSGDEDDRMLCQEYLVFDVTQVLPLCLIEYGPAEKVS